MIHPRLPPWLLPFAVLGLSAAALGGLLFLLAGNPGAARLLTTVPGADVRFTAEAGRERAVEEMAARPLAAWAPWDGQGFMVASGGNKVLWVRVSVPNSGREPVQGVLADSEFFADRAELFIPDAAAGGWRRLRSGEKIPARDKALWGRDTAFPLQIDARATTTVYWRLEDRYGLWLRPVWWPSLADFMAARSRTTLMSGLYFGALLALLFYNAVLWARMRFEDTGRYLLHLAAFAGAMAVARNEPLSLGWALGSPAMEVWCAVLLAWSGAALAAFARATLELPVRAPRADRVVQIARLLMHGLALAALALPWMEHTGIIFYVIIGLVGTHAVVLGAAIHAWRAGAQPARYFLAGFGVLLAGGLPMAWSWLNVVPLEQAWWAEPALLTGSLLQMLLFGMAVADHFARLQQEKAALQEAYSDDLAAEVRERTAELEVANADKDRMLLLLGHDLRSPLTALTQTAERLRRRPSEPAERFAGEVADAGRQLLLLIEDIVLWARLRTGAQSAPARHAMAELIEPAVRLHQPLAERRGLAVVVDLLPELETGTDLVPAQALVRNLVGNAVKFARSRVEIRARCADGELILTVADDGPGLPAEIAAQLQAGAAGPAHGFGLRLCREISGALGLRLEARVTPAGGTEVSIAWPVASGTRRGA